MSYNISPDRQKKNAFHDQFNWRWSKFDRNISVGQQRATAELSVVEQTGILLQSTKQFLK